eukprot:3401258-Rhodomonas_salina.1
MHAILLTRLARSEPFGHATQTTFARTRTTNYTVRLSRALPLAVDHFSLLFTISSPQFHCLASPLGLEQSRRGVVTACKSNARRSKLACRLVEHELLLVLRRVARR